MKLPFLSHRKSTPPPPPSPVSRPAYNNPLAAQLASYIPLQTDLDLYAAIREAIPVVDAALDKLVRLVGSPIAIPAQPSSPLPRGGEVGRGPGERTSVPPTRDAVASINAFLQNVRVNGFHSGLQSFLTPFANDLLTFGRAACELVPTRQRDGLYALVNIDSRSLRVKSADNLLAPQIFQLSSLAPAGQVQLPPEWILYAVRPESGADPNGVSLLRSLPFVSQVLARIHASIGFAWQRVGDPIFLLNIIPSPGFKDDAALTKTSKMVGDLAARWESAMSARRDGDRREDIVALGEVVIKTIGADGQVLDARIPNRVIMEQIVARLGLPPFMLGLSWTTTERMSTHQAETLVSEIREIRRSLEPLIYRLIDTHLALSGDPPPVRPTPHPLHLTVPHPANFRSYSLQWPDVIWRDAVESAKARLWNAQAAEIESRLPL
jgi:hypothetical protein